MNTTYGLDEVPKCPHCNKVLDDDLVARDFVRCDHQNNPKGITQQDYCGWCDKTFWAVPVQNNLKIEFRTAA